MRLKAKLLGPKIAVDVAHYLDFLADNPRELEVLDSGLGLPVSAE